MKIMLVDDHPLFIEGLQYLLQAYGVEVSGTANDGKKALQLARKLHPDVVLMDIRMPVLSGMDALKLIKAEMPGTKVVMLTTSAEDEDLFDAVKYGASGYLLKSTNAAELVDMLRDLENGETVLSEGLAARLLQEFKGSGSSHLNSAEPALEEENVQLTTHQLEVLNMVAKGMTYKEVGDVLGLTERTVKYHMARIIDLLHLENRAQVIAYASRAGLIGDEE